jgi:hypothetical protein
VDAQVEAPGFVEGLAGAAAEHTDWRRNVMGKPLKQGHLVTLEAQSHNSGAHLCRNSQQMIYRRDCRLESKLSVDRSRACPDHPCP